LSCNNVKEESKGTGAQDSRRGVQEEEKEEDEGIAEV
jgi:hypothetical protein